MLVNKKVIAGAIGAAAVAAVSLAPSANAYGLYYTTTEVQWGGTNCIPGNQAYGYSDYLCGFGNSWHRDERVASGQDFGLDRSWAAPPGSPVRSMSTPSSSTATTPQWATAPTSTACATSTDQSTTDERKHHMQNTIKAALVAGAGAATIAAALSGAGSANASCASLNGHSIGQAVTARPAVSRSEWAGTPKQTR